MASKIESITPVDFQSPDQLPPEKKAKLKWVYLVAVAGLFAIGLVLYFMLSAKAVLFRLNVDTAEINLSGGFSLALGESTLLLPGEYQVNITAEGFHPITENLNISSNTPTEITYSLLALPGDLRVILRGDSDESLAGSAKLFGSGLAEAILIQTPDELLFTEIPAGSYQLSVDANLYAEKTIDVDVPGENRTHDVEITMEPNWGWVSVTTDPPHTSFSIDGTTVTSLDTPNSPNTNSESESESIETHENTSSLKIEAGTREFLIELPDYKPVFKELEISKEQVVDLGLIKLEHVDSKIHIQTEPPGVSVMVNENYAGESPVTLDLLPDMEHQIALFKAGFEPKSDRITVTRNSEQNLSYTLEPDLVQVSLSLYPQNSTLKINGKIMAKTSGQVLLPAIKHQVEVAAPGYESQTMDFIPVKGTRQHLQIRLKTEQEALWANIPPNYQTLAGQDMKLFRDPGAVAIGSSRREIGRRANEAPWSANLVRPFYVGLTEVTNQQFKAFEPEHSSGHFEGNSLDGANQPVVNINWQQAALYCNWLSEKEGLAPFYTTERGFVSGTNAESTGYRLLTEAEWSWLAVMSPSGIQQKYAWGDAEDIPGTVENYADQSVAALINFTLETVNDGYITTAPVGSFSANDKGIFDLSGNVNEWMHDWYDTAPYDPDEPVTDPLGPNEGEFHVIRGASWARGYQPQLRLAYRDYDSTARNDLGFRIARYAM